MSSPKRSPLRRWSRLAGMALLAYLVLLVFFAAFQRRMIYFPTRASETALLAEAARIGAEPWREEGGALIGWRVRAPSQPARCRVLVFHGNAGCALHRTSMRRSGNACDRPMPRCGSPTPEGDVSPPVTLNCGIPTRWKSRPSSSSNSGWSTTCWLSGVRHRVHTWERRSHGSDRAVRAACQAACGIYRQV